MMGFGIFRKLKDKFGDLLLHYDDHWFLRRLLERVDYHLTPKVEKKFLRKEKKVEEWTRIEVRNSIQAAWNDVVRTIKEETIRIP